MESSAIAAGGAGREAKVPMELRRTLTIWRQRRVWSRRVEGWERALPPGLDRVIEAVLDHADGAGADVAVDLGCGTGQLALPLATRAARVLAVDVSPEMIEHLELNAGELGLANVEGIVAAIEHLDLPTDSVDLVVSNYALHHLRDPDKVMVVEKIGRWLRPGGCLVIGDMMFGRGGEARDREIIASKLLVLVRRGPGGWWRIAKNTARFLLRVQERPVSMARWEAILRAAGFEEVASHPVVEEAAIVWGRRPPLPHG